VKSTSIVIGAIVDQVYFCKDNTNICCYLRSETW